MDAPEVFSGALLTLYERGGELLDEFLFFTLIAWIGEQVFCQAHPGRTVGGAGFFKASHVIGSDFFQLFDLVGFEIKGRSQP